MAEKEQEAQGDEVTDCSQVGQPRAKEAQEAEENWRTNKDWIRGQVWVFATKNLRFVYYYTKDLFK